MFQRGETIMRIKSMMKGMLAVVMAMSMADAPEHLQRPDFF